MVGNLVGKTEADLLHIEGIGAKAIQELKAGLAERDLMKVIEDVLSATSDDMSQLLDMVFSPDDNILIGGDEPPTFNTEGEDMLGEALPPRSTPPLRPARPGRVPAFGQQVLGGR